MRCLKYSSRAAGSGARSNEPSRLRPAAAGICRAFVPAPRATPARHNAALGRHASRPLRRATCRVSQLPWASSPAPAAEDLSAVALLDKEPEKAPSAKHAAAEANEGDDLLWFSAMGVGSIAWPDDVPDLLTKETLTMKLNVQLLKDHLSERGLPVSGTKAILVGRLLQAVEAELEEVLKMELSGEYGADGLSDHDLLEDFKQSILLSLTGGFDDEDNDEYYDDEDDEEYYDEEDGVDDEGDHGFVDDAEEELDVFSGTAPDGERYKVPSSHAYDPESDDASRELQQAWQPPSSAGTSPVDGRQLEATLRKGGDAAEIRGAYTGVASQEEGWLDLDDLDDMMEGDGPWLDDEVPLARIRGLSRHSAPRDAQRSVTPPQGKLRDSNGGEVHRLPAASDAGREEKEDWTEAGTMGSLEGAPLPSLEASNDDASGGHQMQVMVLATPDRRAQGFLSSCAVLQLQSSAWLFNVGEDFQRHILDSNIRNGKVSRIFINNLQGTHILGLPGMLCTVSSACESLSKFEKQQCTVHIVGPYGLAKFLHSALHISKTFISVPVVVHELVEGYVSKEDMDDVQMSRRGNLSRKLVPPDQLNPFGFSDSFPSNAGKRRKLNERDAQYIRKNLRLSRLIEQAQARSAEETAQWRVGRGEMTWTFRCEGEHLVTAAAVAHDMPSYGFCVEEPARAGKLDPDAAMALGVKPGKDFARLKAGESVTASDGSTVQPEQVVSQDRPGRKLVYTGDCRGPGPAMRRLSQSAGLIMQGGQYPADPVAATNDTSSAAAAGEFAASARARGLILTHIPVEYHDSAWGQNANIENRGDYRMDLVRAAGEAYGHPQAVAAGLDTLTYGIPREDIPEENDQDVM